MLMRNVILYFMSYRIYTLQVQKRGLSSYDDKRYVLADNGTTLAYGHHAIPADAVVLEEDANVPDEEIVDSNIALDLPMPAPADAPPETSEPDEPAAPPKPACWLGREPPLDMIDRVLFAAELVTDKADLPESPNELSDGDFEIVWMQARERAARCEDLRAFVVKLCAVLIENDMVAYIDLTE